MPNKITSIYDFLEQTKDMTPAEAGKEIYGLTEKEIKEILSQKTEKKKEEINPKEKESTEKFASVIPGSVIKQEKDATKYFTDNSEANHLQVISEVQELRKQKKIQYKETSPGTYEISFNLPGSKLKRYMPPDTSIADSSSEYTLWNNTEITLQETTREKLRSDEGKKHLKDKSEKENKNVLSKSDFLKLGKALYPNGSEEEQILAIMIATGFYGRMWLSDKDSSYQLAVRCSRESDNRRFDELDDDRHECSIIYTSTL